MNIMRNDERYIEMRSRVTIAVKKFEFDSTVNEVTVKKSSFCSTDTDTDTLKHL